MYIHPCTPLEMENIWDEGVQMEMEMEKCRIERERDHLSKV